MDEETALLRAICDHPDEDTPRLVFADWLTERGEDGDGAWAELIRVQVALAVGADDQREQFVARERELVPVVSGYWPERMGRTGVTWQNWTRGFPITVAGPGELIRQVYPNFAGRIPLREFNIRAATDADLLALASWPEAHLVHKLGVWTDDAPISPDGFAALVRCEWLQHVERLRLETVRLTDQLANEFLDSRLASGLRYIKMRLAGGRSSLGYDARQRFLAAFGEYDVY